MGRAFESETGTGDSLGLKTAAIIAIGSEMLGPTRIDTNSLKITVALEDFGIEVVRKVVVGDRVDDLAAEMAHSLDRADLLISTGGLGPTEDDLTREALAKAFGLEMQVDQSIIEKIEKRFASRGFRMPDVNKRQGSVFVGQTTLSNERGTAPGFHLNVRGKDLWVFPGVPHELEWMMATYFRPWLESRGSVRRLRRVLRITGLSESGVEERLAPYYRAHEGEPLTILASAGQIELHLQFDDAAAIASREKELLAIFGERVYGFDDDVLEAIVGKLLAERGETIATAESCTGGLLGSRISDIPGSSRYFIGGAVCYAAKAKIDLAGVDPELIRAHGEVSQEVAIALAEGIRARFQSDWGVGITGIAGPGGGSEAKPVGTVHIAVAGKSGTVQKKLFLPFPRTLMKWHSTQAALDMVRVGMGR